LKKKIKKFLKKELPKYLNYSSANFFRFSKHTRKSWFELFEKTLVNNKLVIPSEHSHNGLPQILTFKEKKNG
jgi:hypothetical protein